jgi:hypothetical protein
MAVLAASVSPAPSLPNLTIGLNSSAAPAITYDGGAGVLQLGDGNAAGVVQANNALFISDPVGGANKLGMSPSSATTSVISQTVASGGTVEIGSSSAYNGTLTVSDVPKNNAATYVEINGTAGAVPLFIAAAQGGGGASYIYPDGTGGTQSLNLGSSTVRQDTLTVIEPVAGTSVVRVNGSGGGNAVEIAGGAVPSVSTNFGQNGSLQLRSSASGYAGDSDQNGIVFTDNSTTTVRPLATFKSQIVLPSSNTGQYSGIAGQYTTGITILTSAGQVSGNIANAASATLPLPPSGAGYTGLWMCRILTKNATDTQATQAVQSFTTYWDGALNVFAYGGSANPYFGAVSSVITSNGNARTVAVESGGYITGYYFANFTVATITGMGCQWVQLTGAF